MYSNLRKILIVGFLFFCFQNCSEDADYIPNVSVNVSVDPNTLAQIGIGSSGYCPTLAGVKGIIIFHDIEQFYAFERLCTNYPNDTCAVNIDASKITATCPRCGSQFSLYDGSVINSNSPAKHSLKQYQTSYDGSRLYISN
jgi:Rieske Fe-S protein